MGWTGHSHTCCAHPHSRQPVRQLGQAGGLLCSRAEVSGALGVGTGPCASGGPWPIEGFLGGVFFRPRRCGLQPASAPRECEPPARPLAPCSIPGQDWAVEEGAPSPQYVTGLMGWLPTSPMGLQEARLSGRGTRTSSSLGAPASHVGYPSSWRGRGGRAHSRFSSLFSVGQKRARTLRTLGTAPTATRRAAWRRPPVAPRSRVLSLLPSASLGRS